MPVPLLPDPYLITFPQLGSPVAGYISVADSREATLPFAVQRVFWAYDTPADTVRGRHAHHQTEQVLVAVAGCVTVTTELPGGEVQTFELSEPHLGLYVPPHAWHTIHYAPAAVLLVLASRPYDQADYISRYEEFQEVWRPR